MNLKFICLVILAPFTVGVDLNIKNSCPYTVWIASTPNSNHQPLPGGSVRVETGASYSYSIPGGGWAGRFWPKINCNQAGEECEFGQSSPPCPSQGCQPPADTKVEFNFPSQPPNMDSWYDISLVDGYSLPMKIEPIGINQGACITTNCAMSLDACPKDEASGLGDLSVMSNGRIVACLAPCKKWNYPPPYGLGRSELDEPGVFMCCPTPPIQPQQCSSGPVINTQYVKSIHANCPTAYSYAYDDEAGLHNCPGDTSFDVTFCPSSDDHPCTQWGWRFYDNFDIQGGDLTNESANERNLCQDKCRSIAGCKSYTWFQNTCYFKSVDGPRIPKPESYSAVIC